MARLDELGIGTTTIEHPAVFTVEQAKAHRQGLSGVFTKNLFVRNKKGAMWLVVLQEDRAVDLKALGQRIGAGRLSFGSPERLMRTLGVIAGAVTPFGLINDREQQVRIVLDQDVLAGPPIHFHPLDNAQTTAIKPADLLTFIRSCGHEPEIMDLGGLVEAR
jgi:Ala-tRNA(Pro) deacylase